MRKTANRFIPLASVSVIALGLALAAPASAQQSPAAGTAPGAAAPAIGTAPGAAAPAVGQTLERGAIKDKLGQAGIKDREELKGHMVRAQSPEGHPVLLVIGPERMKGDAAIDDFSQDKVRGQLAAAGFQHIQFVSEPQMVRGAIDDERKVLAISGPGGWQPVAGVAQRDQPDLQRFKSSLDTAGVADRKEFQGKLLRGQGPGGQTVYMVVGPENFEGDQSVSLGATDLQKLQQSGLQNVELVQDVKMVRGKIGSGAVIALAGSEIAQ
jgi:hypothetical protein